jgi:hypothetical protein
MTAMVKAANERKVNKLRMVLLLGAMASRSRGARSPASTASADGVKMYALSGHSL